MGTRATPTYRTAGPHTTDIAVAYQATAAASPRSLRKTKGARRSCRLAVARSAVMTTTEYRGESNTTARSTGKCKATRQEKGGWRELVALDVLACVWRRRTRRRGWGRPKVRWSGANCERVGGGNKLLRLQMADQHPLAPSVSCVAFCHAQTHVRQGGGYGVRGRESKSAANGSVFASPFLRVCACVGGGVQEHQ